MGLDMGLTMFLRKRKDAVSFLFTDTKQTRAKRATVNLAFVPTHGTYISLVSTTPTAPSY